MRSLFVLAAIAANAVVFARPIELTVARFDPSVSTPKLPLSLTTASYERIGLFLVQVEGRVTEEMRARLAHAGATVLDYYPQDTLLVRGDRTVLNSVDGVTWVGPFHPAYRIDPQVGRRVITEPARLRDRIAGLSHVTITLTEDADPEIVQVMLENAGLATHLDGTIGPQAILSAVATRSQIENAARNPGVQYIEEQPERVYRNTTSRWIVQTNIDSNTPLYSAGITGQGQIIGILDGLVYTNHTSFVDSVPFGPTHRKIIYSGGTGSDTHGTHVAATAAGDAGVFDERRGVAFGAKIAYSSDPWPNKTEGTLYNLFVTHQNQGARDHSNSWGDDGVTSYTEWCRAIDRFSWDYEDSMVAFAITNQTSQLKTPENAKSVLAVSATKNAPNQSQNASFGGPGPTIDGRRKPEVCAPGDSIVSAGISNPTALATLGGTSMACPAATASGTLVRQFLKEGRIADGNPNGNFVINPSGALIRAMLIASSVDMTGTTGYPSAREGFGRILLDNVLALPGDTQRTVVRDVRNSAGLSTGGSATVQFMVTSNSYPLRVALTYTDFPAAVGAGSAATNNLDLTVQSPSATYLGNVFTSGQSSTGGSADAINSTEMVMRNTPNVGLYTVTIGALNVPSGPQGYALVINGAVTDSRITGTVNLGDWVGTYPSTIPVTFLNAGGSPYPGGTVNAVVNPGTHAFTVDAPPSVTGSFRLRFNHGAHLLKTVPSMASPAETNRFAATGTITLTNGDPDRTGEVDAADIDLVIAHFGQTGVSPANGDVDGSGEVDAADIDICIANFGSVNN